MKYLIEECEVFRDERGTLLQFIDENILQANKTGFGQIYVLSFAGKNVVRGNHYHKNSSETFSVVYGEVKIFLKDVETGESFSKIFNATDKTLFRISIGPGIAHSIKSISDFALVVSHSSKIYDPLDEDKYAYALV